MSVQIAIESQPDGTWAVIETVVIERAFHRRVHAYVSSHWEAESEALGRAAATARYGHESVDLVVTGGIFRLSFKAPVTV